MAYDQLLAQRVRQQLELQAVDFFEKAMMGGLAFMVDNKMCLGIVRTELMARIGPGAYESALEQEGVREMNFTGRSMKGYVFVDQAAIPIAADLAHWVQLCLDFNPLAKASKKRKRKSDS